MAVNKYTTGSSIDITATFTNKSGVETDPSAITFRVLDPDGTITTYTYGVDAEVVKSATGIYVLTVEVTKENTWYYKVNGTGSLTAAEEGSFIGKYSKID